MFLLACSAEEGVKTSTIGQAHVAEINGFVPEYLAAIPEIVLTPNEYRNYPFQGFLVGGLVDSASFKQGYWRIYDEKSNVSYEGVFVDNLPTGWWKVLSGEKLICAGNYERGIKQGYWGYLPYGQFTTSKYVNYLDDTLVGLAREFTTDSVLLVDGHYKNGLRQGYWKFYYLSGSMKQQGPYHQNYKSGWWQSFDETGNLYGEANYSKGQISGWVRKHKNGFITEEGEQFNGERCGVWTFYDSTGKQTRIQEYDED